MCVHRSLAFNVYASNLFVFVIKIAILEVCLVCAPQVLELADENTLYTVYTCFRNFDKMPLNKVMQFLNSVMKTFRSIYWWQLHYSAGAKQK